jgi:DNA repair exonuclease SbcCD ATPase subunit
MTGQNMSTSDPVADLESTAELPVLDATAFEPTPPWIVARARAAAEARRGEQRPARIAGNSELAEARQARAAAEQRAEEVARELAQVRKTARDELQAQLAARDARQAELERQLLEARQPREQMPRHDEITARDQRIQELEAYAREQSASFSRSQSELLARLEAADQLLRRSATQRSEEQAAALDKTRKRVEELESALFDQKHHAEGLEAELSRVRKKTETRPPAGGAESTSARAQIGELNAQLAEQREAASTLRAEAAASTARVQKLETDLKAAEEAVNRRDSELQMRSAKLTELEALCAQLRAEGEDRRAALSERDALIQKLKDDPGDGSERAPFGAQRLLIRTDGDTEIAHVLGRRTSIGRSSDNDVQVEATSISRHHALILSGPTSSVIEDLHSTNGVRVNGRRVTMRQPLRDGDAVIIGKAQFRFVMRDAPEEA